MSNPDRRATITFFSILIISAIVFEIVAIRFFTKEEIRKNTLEKMAKIEKYMEDENIQDQELEKDTQENSEILFNEEIYEINYDWTNENDESIVENKQEIVDNKNVEVKPVVSKTVTTESNIGNVLPETKKETVVADTVKETTNNTVENKKEDMSVYNGFSSVGRIEIPKTGVNLAILSNVSVNGMEIASCLLYSTGELNKSGKTLIVGHNYRNGKLFSNNGKLQEGDKIYITSLDGNRVEYTVYQKISTTPDDVSFLLDDTNGTPEIVLSTCSDDESYRIVIFARSN